MFEIEYRYKSAHGYARIILRKDANGWFFIGSMPTGDEVSAELGATDFDAAIAEVGEHVAAWEAQSGGNPL